MSDLEELLGMRPLTQGESVRVRLSGECPHSNGDPTRQHDEDVDGLVGTVRVVRPLWHGDSLWYPDHPYHVDFPTTRQAIGQNGHVTRTGAFARSELERISPHRPVTTPF